MKKVIKAKRSEFQVPPESLEQGKIDVVDEFTTQCMVPDSELYQLLSGYVDDDILEDGLQAAMHAFNQAVLG